MPVMQIYGRPVALDRNIHAGLRIIKSSDFGFARACQTAMLAAVEINRASKEFPVVFVKENENYLPMCVLGLQQGQNLFVDEQGRWNARYVPAFLRRYPFVPALGQGTDLTICIDESAACVSREQGEPLFVDGANSPLLAGAIQLIQEYKTQTDATLGLTRELAAAGLFSDKSVQFKFNDGPGLNLTGFLTVDADKLAGLAPEAVFKLLKSGALHLAFMHLSSQDNWEKLIELLEQRTQHDLAAAELA